VVIGSEMSGDVRNVVISNCVFINTDRGIRMKSRRGRGAWLKISGCPSHHGRRALSFTMNLYYFCNGAWRYNRIG